VNASFLALTSFSTSSAYDDGAAVTGAPPAGGGPPAPAPPSGALGMSGYSKVTPGSHSNTGQQLGKSAVLLVLSDSLHLGFGFGRGPQSATSSQSLPCCAMHVDLPQNGFSSQVAPGSKVAHLVDAKQVPGKSRKTSAGINLWNTAGESPSGFSFDEVSCENATATRATSKHATAFMFIK